MTNLQRWHLYLRDIESPNIYIDWTFYAMISASLQRRVAWQTQPHASPPGTIFANTFIVFIGPPGVGKSSSARWAVHLFKEFGGFDKLSEHTKRIIKVAPSSLTLEQLYRYMTLNANTVFKISGAEKIKGSDGKLFDPIYMTTPLAFFCTEELGTLFRENTGDTVTFLQEGWDCHDFHRETKTQGVDFIPKMCISMLGAATPSWVQEVSKNGLLKQGFSARTIFVWGEEKRHLRFDYHYDAPEQVEAWAALKTHVQKLTTLYGAARPSPEAEEWMLKWYEGGGEVKRINHDKKLDDYYARKKVHLIKLAMLCHFAEDASTLVISVDAFKRALALLTHTEVSMHKALLGSGATNPAHAASERIKKCLEERINGSEYVREAVLLNDVFEFCDGGRVTFDEALRYLQDSGQIIAMPMGGRMTYKLNKTADSSTTHEDLS